MNKIFVCDDDKSIHFMVTRILSGLYEVETFLGIEELFDGLKKEKPNLIMLDYQMPDCDGIQGLDRLSKEGYFPEVPVIMVTGERDARLETLCFEKGMEDFIQKPFVPDVLISRVAHVIEKSESEKELRRKMNEAINRSEHDSMTGLFNREYISKYVDKYVPEHKFGSFFMIDLDNFKYLNDTYGHVTGDDAICAVADIIREAVEGKGIAFRLGGDEFGIFLEDKVEKESLENFVADLFGEYNRQAVEKDYLVNSSLSIGISLFPEDGKDYFELYSAADKALYYAKRNGKNGYCFYSVDYTDTSNNRREVVDIRQLKRLIEDKRELRNQRGVYKVDYREFQRIYNFIERCVERTHQRAKLVLVSLIAEENMNSTQIEEQMKNAEEAIAKSLRRNDVGTRYSSTQFLLVLIDVDEESMKNIIENRINQNYIEISKDSGCLLLFEQMNIDPDEMLSGNGL